MNNFFNIHIINNQYAVLNVGGLILIAALVIITSIALIIIRKIKKNLSKKHPKWQPILQNISRISILLLFVALLVAVLEIMDIRMTEYMSTTLFKSDNILITPSRLLFIIVLFLIASTISLGLKSFFTGYFSHNEASSYAILNVFKLVKYLLWIIIALIAMNAIGLNLTFLMAGSAALLVGVGIGMQNIFNDVISGFFLLFERNLKINDVVEVDGVAGSVKDIGMRTSRILTRDNIEMIVPNSKFISEKVVNWSYNDAKTRFFLKINVAYGSDIMLVKNILLEIAGNHNLILTEPQPRVFFRDYGDSSLLFELAFWTSHSLENEVIKSDLRFELNQKFIDNKIQIPFPQRDIHIISENNDTVI
jgi:small-conductance mechanosensitive channel